MFKQQIYQVIDNKINSLEINISTNIEFKTFNNALKLNKSLKSIKININKDYLSQLNNLSFFKDLLQTGLPNDMKDIDILYYLIVKNSNVKSLDLSNNKLLNVDYLLLNKIDALQSLYLSDNNIINIDKVSIFLKENKTLKILDLKNNKITKIDKLLEALTINNTLQYIDLCGNNINKYDKQRLFELQLLKPKLRLYY